MADSPPSAVRPISRLVSGAAARAVSTPVSSGRYTAQLAPAIHRHTSAQTRASRSSSGSTLARIWFTCRSVRNFSTLSRSSRTSSERTMI
jgi:hypothetical protein